MDAARVTPPVETKRSEAIGSPMVPALARVRRHLWETRDCFTLIIDAPGQAGPHHFAFQPGQFNMLYVFGVGEAPISMSGDGGRPDSIVHTIRAVGSVTHALAKLKRGDPIGLRGPFGSAWPIADCKGHDIVLVAGGIGLAPLRPAIHHLLSQRDHYRNICLLLGARSPADLVFLQEIHQWRNREQLQVLLTVDRPDDGWHEHVGVVTTLFAQAHFDPARTIGLICGPEVMMRFTLREFNKWGVPDDRLFLSLERNMQCAIGFCGHCQFGPSFVCMDGPVFRYDRIKNFFLVREA